MLSKVQDVFPGVPLYEPSTEYDLVDKIENEVGRPYFADLIYFVHDKRKLLSEYFGLNLDDNKIDLISDMVDMIENRDEYKQAYFERTKYAFSLIDDLMKEEIFNISPHLKSLMKWDPNFFNSCTNEMNIPKRFIERLKCLPEKSTKLSYSTIKKDNQLSIDDSNQEEGKSSKQHKEEKSDLKGQSNSSQRPNLMSSIIGIDDIKEEIQEVINMIKDPDSFKQAGAKQLKGILLMGSPGTGKTMLAKALAKECSANFIICNGADFDKPLVGQGNNVIKSLFNQARKNQPCIIFIDEIDSLLHKNRRSGKSSTSNDRSLINTFLSEMDGFSKRERIFVLGATNSEKDLDSAAIRPGRFDKLITVPLPDTKGREDMFKFFLNKVSILL